MFEMSGFVPATKIVQWEALCIIKLGPLVHVHLLVKGFFSSISVVLNTTLCELLPPVIQTTGNASGVSGMKVMVVFALGLSNWIVCFHSEGLANIAYLMLSLFSILYSKHWLDGPVSGIRPPQKRSEGERLFGR